MLPGKSITPDEILRVAARRKWYLVVPVMAGAFAALLVSRFLPNQYESDTLIQIVPQRIPDSYVRSTVTTEVDDRLKSIEQQIMSRTRLEQTILELNLYPEERRSSPMEDVVVTMRTRIGVDLVTGPPRRGERPIEAFRVRFKYHDAQIAMRVTERLASWFIDENARLRGTLADATNEFLESQLLDAKRRLVDQERKVKEFRERHAGSLPDQLMSNFQAIQSTQIQLQAVVESSARDRDRKLMLERLYNEAVAEQHLLDSQPPPAPVGQAPAPGSVTAQGSPRQQLEAARSQLAIAESRLTPEHPDIRRLKRIIADLEAKVEAETKVPAGEQPVRTVSNNPFDVQRRDRITNLKAEMESLTSQIAFKEREEKRMRALVASYQARIEAVPGVETEWAALSRDYETLQQSYKNLLQKSEESKVAANLERQQIGEQVRVLDPPRVPGRPVSPQRLVVNAAGAVIGLVIGLGIVGLLEFTNSTYRTEADVVNALGLPVLAIVPAVHTSAELRAFTRRRWKLTAGVAIVLVAAAGLAVFLQLWRYVL
jgi:polysaccharide chain length determinant protein (PEP-CTERM system associated)